MIKTTLKSVAIALSVLAAVMIVLTVADGAQNVGKTLKDTYLKVSVVDLDGAPVHNATVAVDGQCFFTDNKGCSPLVEFSSLSNSYDQTLSDWGTCTVTITKDGYAPTLVFNCVVFRSQTRNLTVKIYPRDSSDLPYVSYVETPPDEYIRHLLGNDGV